MAASSVIVAFWQEPLRPVAARSVLSFFKISGAQRNIVKAGLAASGTLEIKGGYRELTAAALAEKSAALGELEAKYLPHPGATIEEQAALRVWFATRRKEMAILQAAWRLQEGETDEAAGSFNAACASLYGAYNIPLFAEYIDQILRVAPPEKRQYIANLQQQVNFEYLSGHQRAAYIEPTVATFAHYKSLAADMVADIRQVVSKYVSASQRSVSSATVQKVIDELLAQIGATRQGWQTQTREYVHKLSVNTKKKTVYIKKSSFQCNRRRLIGIMAHEVYIHVRRKMHDEPLHLLIAEALPENAAFEEGLGVLAEQLCLDRYYPLRQFRFIAIGLALGVDGRPRNLMEVYEILWQLRHLSGNYTVQAAKNYAFDEALRAFRGIPLDSRGIAYSRDKIYTEGNATIWRRLEASPLGAAAFQLFLTTGRHL
jgi:hypothetical protein